MTRENYRGAYERSYRITQLLMKMLRLPRQHPSIREAYEVVWYRTAKLVREKPDKDGLYPHHYRRLAPP